MHAPKRSPYGQRRDYECGLETNAQHRLTEFATQTARYLDQAENLAYCDDREAAWVAVEGFLELLLETAAEVREKVEEHERRQVGRHSA